MVELGYQYKKEPWFCCISRIWKGGVGLVTEHLKKAVELEDTRGFTRKFRGENKIHLMEICFNNRGRFMKITEIATRRKPLLLVIPEGVKAGRAKWFKSRRDFSERKACSPKKMVARENMIILGKIQKGLVRVERPSFHLWEEDQLKFILKKWGRVTEVAREAVKLWVEMHPNVVLPALLEVEDGAWKYTVVVSVIGEEGEDDTVTSETTHCRYEWLKEGGCVSQTTKFAEGLRGSIRGNECYSRELLLGTLSVLKYKYGGQKGERMGESRLGLVEENILGLIEPETSTKAIQ
ncbi:hypothetical protein CK203_082055 [Vitis vinifera]|uniref:DUF4283 domain-containing protein n=1 Tax=Vitis vinifera TaxID=29760 RepID=A0A438E221_VITVI|nr:hypothetical protein CK203_082055 [Vitis vinifera]